ncbi:MAG: hypothetical protein BSOLF_0230 [Candidatus Carbobacillus altaicus]|uniref:Uncharacterized protein n=1 Tax=Candidatus Carbonibacillus altaicus TaxID=2163959 RepID=A0A2R6XXI4_9BACL|nr:MAG: hypothetical protein BSOLF_0230 [Candidatus Carbobacillus altaicus]
MAIESLDNPVSFAGSSTSIEYTFLPGLKLVIGKMETMGND